MLRYRRRFLLLAGIAAGSLGSCVHSDIDTSPDPYPAGWEPLQDIGIDCSGLAGRYEATGEPSHPVDYPVTLRGSVFGYPSALDTPWVDLSYLPDNTRLIAEFTANGSGGRSDTVTIDGVSCVADGLRYATESRGYVDGTSSRSRKSIRMSRSRSYLLVHFQYQAASSALVIFRDSEQGDVWYRFREVPGPVE